MEIDDGGPAFPHENWETLHGDQVTSIQSHGGMSLRDWFAGTAPAMPNQWWNDEDSSYAGAVAAWRYSFADAMLKARAAKAKE